MPTLSRDPSRKPPTEQSRLARDALVRAALVLFGARGFDATSTRDIARAAKTNIAAITYHFGGKEGLRTACAGYIAGRVGSILGSSLPDPQQAAGLDPAEAAEAILQVARAMLNFLVADKESETVARFVIREQLYPTQAFDQLYTGLFEPMHKRFCALWAKATGMDAASPETRLMTFNIIGQITYYRLGRSTVMRRMEWQEQTMASHMPQLVSLLELNIHASIREASRHA